MKATTFSDLDLYEGRLLADRRCDRCGARPQVLVMLQGGDLTFCGHHARQFASALQASATEILHITDDGDLVPYGSSATAA